jgi:hypothetical protein
MTSPFLVTGTLGMVPIIFIVPYKLFDPIELGLKDFLAD